MKTLQEMIDDARAAGACKDALNELAYYEGIAHLRASAPTETQAYWAFWYARDVIKGRWPKAEPVIAKSAEWAFWYARDVIKGRWPEAEPVIAKSAKWAYWYARYVIKGPWPEARI